MTPADNHSPIVIDVHSHFFPEEFLTVVEREGPPHGAGVDRRGKMAFLVMPGHPPSPLAAEFIDSEARVARLDAAGIGVQAVSLSPPMVYWAPTDLGIRLARAYNDGIAALCRRYMGRFIGLATLPLQDVSAAKAEMIRAAGALGMRGVYVATSVRGQYLDEPAFRPLWESAHRLGLPVFTHPHTHLGVQELANFHLFNTIGFPTETAVLVGRLIYSGLLDDYPEVRVVLAHAGGTVPFLLGRLDHAYHSRQDLQRALSKPPSAYLKHLVFDTITHSDRALQFLIDAVGAERVVVGSDAPYDMADEDPVGRVKRLTLPGEAEAAILGLTAARLLNVPVTQSVMEN